MKQEKFEEKRKTVLLIRFKNGMPEKHEEGSVSLSGRDSNDITIIRDLIRQMLDLQHVFTLILDKGRREKSYNPSAVQSIEIMDKDTLRQVK